MLFFKCLNSQKSNRINNRQLLDIYSVSIVIDQIPSCPDIKKGAVKLAPQKWNTIHSLVITSDTLQAVIAPFGSLAPRNCPIRAVHAPPSPSGIYCKDGKQRAMIITQRKYTPRKLSITDVILDVTLTFWENFMVF